MTSTNAPRVSFCIPTYNRCRYLASLLESLIVQLADFPYSFELVIADNGSTDQTAETIDAYAERLPIRALRHASNIGGYGNWQFVLAQAAGRYVVYVADDDSLIVNHVATAIAQMEADPGIAVVYAPWLLFDLVAQQSHGPFYSVPRDLRIERNEHVQLLDDVLRHHIFPEIQITRRDVMQATDAAHQRARLLRVRARRRLPHARRDPDPAASRSTSRSPITSRTTCASRSATARSNTPGTATAAASNT